MSLPAWLDDGPQDASSPAISLLDAGLRSGLGLFETLRAHGTAMIAAERHLARLARGASELGIGLDIGRVEHAVMRTLAEPRDVQEVVVRITLTAGPVSADAWPTPVEGRPTLMVTLHPAPTLPRPAGRATCVPARRWPAELKSTSYLASIVAQRLAREAGGDIALLVEGEEALETAEGNLLVVLDGTLVTPPVDGRLLAGVTREVILEAAAGLGVATTERPILVGELRIAEAVLVSSAVVGIRTLQSLDGGALRGSDADGPPHPIVVGLRDALESRRR